MASYKASRSVAYTTAFAGSVFKTLANTETNQRLQAAVEAGKHHDLLDAFDACDPRGYTDALEFRDDWLAVNLLRKAIFLNLEVDRTAVAMEKFRLGELACAASNIRLLRPYAGPTCIGGPSVESVIHTTRRKIGALLGRFSWEHCSEFMGFSSGASVSLPRTKGDPWYKYQTLEVTHDAKRVALAVVPSYFPLWDRYLRESGMPLDGVKPVLGNVVLTVPKNAKTERTIAKEPSVNMFLQRGIGGRLRKLLRRVGVNLNDQGINQRLALIAAKLGELATLDLSAASDSVSIAVCELLLPPDWFEAMMLVRSHFGRLPDGSLVRYEKMSSMGNGFTFELESLIFWALTASVCDLLALGELPIGIYGDDIICPVAAVPLLTKTLSFCGFELNTEKSFWSGPFRESCGKHYFLGVDVTPMYIEEPIRGYFNTCLVANQLRRWAERASDGWSLDERVFPLWDALRQQLPPNWRRPRIPDGVGDGALYGSLCEVLPRYSRGRGAFVANHKVLRDVKQSCTEWPGVLRWMSSTPPLPEGMVLLRKSGRSRTDRASVMTFVKHGWWAGQEGDSIKMEMLNPDAGSEISCEDLYMERWSDSPCWGSLSLA